MPHHSQPQLQPLTLEIAKAAFADWRNTRTHMTKIPDSFWDMVFKLEGNYKTSKILDALGISGTQYRKAKLKREAVSCEEPTFTTFVPLSNDLTVEDNLSARAADTAVSYTHLTLPTSGEV